MWQIEFRLSAGAQAHRNKEGHGRKSKRGEPNPFGKMVK
jgi:hypothetical protein